MKSIHSALILCSRNGPSAPGARSGRTRTRALSPRPVVVLPAPDPGYPPRPSATHALPESTAPMLSVCAVRIPHVENLGLHAVGDAAAITVQQITSRLRSTRTRTSPHHRRGRQPDSSPTGRIVRQNPRNEFCRGHPQRRGQRQNMRFTAELPFASFDPGQERRLQTSAVLMDMPSRIMRHGSMTTNYKL